MSVLIIILGVLMTILGFTCLFTPLSAAFGAMYFYLILFLVSGISMIVHSIVTKRYGVELVFGILSVIAGGLVLVSPQMTFITEIVLLYIAASWLILRGIVGIINACQLKQYLGGGMFAFSLIMSILVILAGIYSFVHPKLFAGFIGILVSCFFIVEGVDMIVSGVIGKKIERVIF